MAHSYWLCGVGLAALLLSFVTAPAGGVELDEDARWAATGGRRVRPVGGCCTENENCFPFDVDRTPCGLNNPANCNGLYYDFEGDSDGKTCGPRPVGEDGETIPQPPPRPCEVPSDDSDFVI